MATLLSELNSFTQWLLIASLKSLPLVAIILLAQYSAKKYFSASARYGLWLSLFISLCIPVGWQMSFTKTPEDILNHSQATPAALTPAPPINSAVTITSANATPTVARDNSPQTIANAINTLGIHSVLSLLWLCGCIVLISITLWQAMRFNRIQQSATPASQQQYALLEHYKNTLRLTQKIPLLYSAQVSSPLTLGLFKPTIILPVDIEQQLSESQLRHVLLHELAHIQRRDILWNWLAFWVTLLHWFNPATWFAYKRMKGDMEMACDAHVLAHLANKDRTDYGLTLISVSQLPTEPHGFSRSLSILENHRDLQHRLIMIKDCTTMNTKKTWHLECYSACWH